MKDDNEDTGKGRGSTRIRKKIYGERVIVSLRMEKDLHTRLMEYCDEITIPANKYINDLIASDLKKKKK